MCWVVSFSKKAIGSSAFRESNTELNNFFFFFWEWGKCCCRNAKKYQFSHLVKTISVILGVYCYWLHKLNCIFLQRSFVLPLQFNFFFFKYTFFEVYCLSACIAFLFYVQQIAVKLKILHVDQMQHPLSQL